MTPTSITVRYNSSAVLPLLLTRLHMVYGATLVTVAGVCRRLSSSVVCRRRLSSLCLSNGVRWGLLLWKYLLYRMVPFLVTLSDP